MKSNFDSFFAQLLNMPVIWSTPSNMLINMSNLNLKEVKIRNNLLKSSKPITIVIPSNNPRNTYNYRDI